MSDLSPDLSGRTLGNWSLLKLLGEGAFGAVYEAQHLSISSRRAAVKVLHPHLAFHKDIKRRFVSEATVACQAEHENIVQIFDGGTSQDGTCYVAMELLAGESLRKLLARVGRLDVGHTVAIAMQVASALVAAHRLGIVHRDLKPDNVFVIARPGKGELIKVLDFGIAKLQNQETRTTTGTLLGTPLYMSPEQWQTLPDIDGRADLYALGVMLFECLTGKPPYDGPNQYALMRAHIESPIPDPAAALDLPPELARLIRRLLAKSRDDRPRDAEQVLRVLRAPQGVSDVAHADTLAQPIDPFGKTLLPAGSGREGAASLSLRQQAGERVQRSLRSRVSLLVAACGIGLLGGALFFATRSTQPVSPPPQPVKAAGAPVAAAVNPEGPARAAKQTPSAAESGSRPRMIPLPIHPPGQAASTLWMSETEITQGQYKQLMAINPSDQLMDSEGKSKPCRVRGVGDALPVFCVSFSDALRYANRLSQSEGLSACYAERGSASWEAKSSCDGYRLPSETEWASAAAAGQSTRYAGSDTLAEVGWYKRNSHGRVQAVKGKAANAWGLFDMSGNVYEWTTDPFQGQSPSPAAVVTLGPSERAVRGGSFYQGEAQASIQAREPMSLTEYSTGVGFRIVRSGPPPERAAAVNTQARPPSEPPQSPHSAPDARLLKAPPATESMALIPGTQGIPSFWIDRTEVTVAAYLACMAAGRCNAAGFGDACNVGNKERVIHPINCVTFEDALQFCSWAGKRLPLGTEWELAARGSSGRAYPWGSTQPAEQLCWKRLAGAQGTCPVGTHRDGDTPEGVQDLAGNVWEWVSEGDGKPPVVRGGAWVDDKPAQVGTLARDGSVPPNRQFGSVGFRCARDQ